MVYLYYNACRGFAAVVPDGMRRHMDLHPMCLLQSTFLAEGGWEGAPAATYPFMRAVLLGTPPSGPHTATPVGSSSGGDHHKARMCFGRVIDASVRVASFSFHSRSAVNSLSPVEFSASTGQFECAQNIAIF